MNTNTVTQPWRPRAKPPAMLFVLLLSLTSGAARAQTSLSEAIDDYLRQQTQGLPGKVSYTIGQLDQYARLTPCNNFAPFLPAGSRLWGNTTLGIRCLGPTRWSVYVPVQIKVMGNYLVTARSLAAGQVVTPTDVSTQHGDLGSLPASALTDLSQALGRTVRNGIASGQPLRGEQLTAAWVVQQGQSVKLLSAGAGFIVSNEGKALNNAAQGQVVQVRTASGQVVSGLARTGGVVEVSY
ncbi:MAG: flagellar basal body P-ring formation protein FlgA [Candidatus Accumulibacter sp.]|jgi:flagella basal body P-ring formation protein FlgA|uniref:flagellar basal body P-ring formation chaperone FlgA n=1 Tax=Accumulibacter sp. TaxID=2053492 RepID=UPI001A56656B|nr:flagellar basal body P-ring formation chaperone FlgA [Accumulibacter sp.]MBL8393755.1 flagellar basal body P-ring formation protein FlgA [Accumulibacter sp.]